MINDMKKFMVGIFGDDEIISRSMFDDILKYIDFLKQENTKKNLISRKTTDQDIIYKHIVSSFLFVKYILMLDKKQKLNNIIDIGSGSGFPGIVCSICLPGKQFMLVDSVKKKVDFLNDVVKHLGLKNLKCLWGRIENFANEKEYKKSFDIVTARALGTLELTTKYSMPFLRSDGVFLTIKSFNQKEELDKAFKYIETLGYSHSIFEEKIGESYIVMVKG
jgi:16S rRNA (guanine527-N7)-methyltransferase